MLISKANPYICALDLISSPLSRNISPKSVPLVGKHALILSVPKQNETQPKIEKLDFPGGAVVKNPPANAGDTGSSSGLGRSHMPRSN